MNSYKIREEWRDGRQLERGAARRGSPHPEYLGKAVRFRNARDAAKAIMKHRAHLARRLQAVRSA